MTMEEHEERIRKSLRYSIASGAFYSSMVGFGESFFAAFAIFLNATSLQLGLLTSLPQAMGSFSQMLSNRLLNKWKSRKKIVLFNVFMQAIMFVPISLVFFLGGNVFYLIAFVTLYWILGMVSIPAWTSWIGDLVSPKERGSYFGRRNKIGGIASLVSMLAAGAILSHFSGAPDYQYLGFLAIFLLAMSARLASFSMLSREYEPEYKTIPEAHFGFMDFVRQARFRNYGLFTLYMVFMNFSVFLAAPFFAAYMLNTLAFDYFTFTLLNITAVVTKLLAMPVWGRAADQFGTRKILSLSGFLMPLVPVLWLVSPDALYLGFVQAYAGFVWAGFEISSFNFMFDTTTPEKRATCVAYYNVLNGAGIFAGGLMGGVIVSWAWALWPSYLLIFLVSGILRFGASLAFVPKLREVREVEHIPYRRLFFDILTVRPTMGSVYNIITIRKKFKGSVSPKLRSAGERAKKLVRKEAP